MSMLYEPDAEELEGTAVVSGPLTDSLSGRLAIRYRETDGYLDNIYLDDGEANREESTFRGTLQWDATEDLRVTLKGEVGSFDVKGRNMEIISDNPSVNPAFGGMTYSEIQVNVFGQPEAGLNVKQDQKRTSNVDFSNNDTENVTMTMGCYGIGVSRIVASAIEQNHDDSGIIWPASMAPFQLAIVPLNMQKSEAVASCAEALYEQLQAAGVEVLLDDRNERPGVKFADMELIGIPHRIVIGDRALAEDQIEYKGRQDTDSQLIARDKILDFVLAQLA